MAEKIIQLKDRRFKLFLSHEQINAAVEDIARQINYDFQGEKVIFLGILNGSFMFAADLIRKLTLPEPVISFLKLSSYRGTSSTGKTKQLIGIGEDLKGQTVIILEDIIDTGITLETIIGQLNDHGCREVRTATLLLKPDAYRSHYRIDYVGIRIPNDFVVGYGLDYDGAGRHLSELYHEVK